MNGKEGERSCLDNQQETKREGRELERRGLEGRH